MKTWCVRPALLTAALALGWPAGASAGDKFEQDRARAALQSGQAMSFAAVQERLHKACDCQVLEAKLHPEKDSSGLIYEIKALRPDGQILKLEMNAASGEILRMKNKGWKD
ncbi:PepSY domain-containing protein [Uliginosibacterium aquaticum]|uniref:PepSY domain-containing protein n=1 Tax=Uliginosibacterium aquaticum TaxID=2731212 RepID=A0ABX2IBW0_9RHOO|nr:PepSY domain-containing protein [Uliginosibacterium aquaticum]NSL53939.1 PepSY domain-containing protein [Uliginosibacterium aquaticum]